MPYPDVPVPDSIVPTPISALELANLDHWFERILWVKLAAPKPVTLDTPQLQNLKNLRRRRSLTVNMQGGIQNESHIYDEKEANPTLPPIRDVENPTPEDLSSLPSTSPTPNYF